MPKLNRILLLTVIFALTQVFPVVVNQLSIIRHNNAEQDATHIIDLKICSLAKIEAGAVVSFVNTQLQNETQSIKAGIDVRYHKIRIANLILWNEANLETIKQACANT